MHIEKSEMTELASLVATAVVQALESKGLVGTPGTSAATNQTSNANGRTEKTAYQKTEQLLYNYMGFKRIIKERLLEIETIKKYGVPKKSTSIVEYSPRTGTVHGITLEEESVEAAVRNVYCAIEGTVQAVDLIDKCMDALRGDPYYCILEMRYFEGRTQEDIADHLGCSQVTISKNKSRLIKELSIRLFPNQVIGEMLQ